LFRTDSAGANTLLGTFSDQVTSFIDSNLTANQQYRYYVLASNLAGDGPSGAQLIVSTPTPEKPDQITLVVLERATNNSITLSWTPPESNGAGIDSYDIYCVNGSAIDYLDSAPGSATQWTFTRANFTASTFYSFRIRFIPLNTHVLIK